MPSSAIFSARCSSTTAELLSPRSIRTRSTPWRWSLRATFDALSLLRLAAAAMPGAIGAATTAALIATDAVLRRASCLRAASARTRRRRDRSSERSQRSNEARSRFPVGTGKPPVVDRLRGELTGSRSICATPPYSGDSPPRPCGRSWFPRSPRDGPEGTRRYVPPGKIAAIAVNCQLGAEHRNARAVSLRVPRPRAGPGLGRLQELQRQGEGDGLHLWVTTTPPSAGHGSSARRTSPAGRRARPVFLLWRGRLFTSRPMLWALMLAFPFTYIANIAGWTTAEAGRQPWLVYGLLHTADGASPASSVSSGT